MADNLREIERKVAAEREREREDEVRAEARRRHARQRYQAEAATRQAKAREGWARDAAKRFGDDVKQLRLPSKLAKRLAELGPARPGYPFMVAGNVVLLTDRARADDWRRVPGPGRPLEPALGGRTPDQLPAASLAHLARGALRGLRAIDPDADELAKLR